jgi:putative membrane protein
MINAKTPHVVLVLTALASMAACSKDEPSSKSNYGQPAASMGDESTPAESRSMGPQAPSAQAAQTPGSPAAPPAESPATTGPAAMPAPVTPAVSLTNDQIAKITDTVDTGEIEQAKIAKNKAKDPRVKKFAAHMIDQHTQAKQKSAQLAKNANLVPADSSIASELQTKGTQQLEALKAADATTFDNTYMTGQVQQHQEVLNLLSNQLIPGATNADLKAHLTEAHTMVQSHLDQAREIDQALSSAPRAH